MVDLTNLVALQAVLLATGPADSVFRFDPLAVRARVLVVVDLAVRRRIFGRIGVERCACSHVNVLSRSQSST